MRLLRLCWPLASGDGAKSAAEVGVHHAVGVPMEVRQDDGLRMLLHLYSHRTFRSVLHVPLVTVLVLVLPLRNNTEPYITYPFLATEKKSTLQNVSILSDFDLYC